MASIPCGSICRLLTLTSALLASMSCQILTPYEDLIAEIPSDQFREVEGLKWHVPRWGQGEPVLLLHGFGASSHSYQDLAKALEGEPYHLIAPDLLGFGHTERPTAVQAYDPLSQTRHLLSLLDDLQIPQAHLVGHSYGGGLAMLFAQSYPHRVRTLTLIAPIRYFGSPVAWLRHRTWRSTAYPLLLGALWCRPLVRTALRQGFENDRLATPERIDAYRSRLLVEGLRHAYHGHLQIPRYQTRYRLEPERLLMPTLVLWGQDDRVLPPAQTSRWLRSLPETSFVLLSKCGHLLPEEAPELLAYELTAFWAQKRRASHQ